MTILIVALFVSIVVLCHGGTVETSHPASDKIIGKYIELSMNLTILLADTAIDEAKIHQVCDFFFERIFLNQCSIILVIQRYGVK